MPDREQTFGEQYQPSDRVRLLSQMAAAIYGARVATEVPDATRRPMWIKAAYRDSVLLLMEVADGEGEGPK